MFFYLISLLDIHDAVASLVFAVTFDALHLAVDGVVDDVVVVVVT